jgi:type I restriction enzyme M protein
MRRKMIEADLIECVVGLGPNLFYNASMESCIVICRTQKPKARRGKILYINAVNEVTRERAQSFLTEEHLQRVVRAYQEFKDELGFTKVAGIAEVRANGGNLGLPLYVENAPARETADTPQASSLPSALKAWLAGSAECKASLTSLLSSYQ